MNGSQTTIEKEMQCMKSFKKQQNTHTTRDLEAK